jgi:hypothetical protein
VNHGQKHVSVAIDEAHLSFTRHVDLIQLHFNDFSGMLNLNSGRLSAHHIENPYHFLVCGID